MKNLFNNRVLTFFFGILSYMGCQQKDISEPVLNVSVSQLHIASEGGDSSIIVKSSDHWSINNSASWIQLDKTNGRSGSDTIRLSTEVNSTGSARSTILNVSSSNGQARRITVSQPSLIFPSYNISPKAPDISGMESNAVQLAAKINLGWNIGNTLEAPGGETGWGNPRITESYIQFVKQCGFNAIRLPCAWNWHHVDDNKTARIKTEWLERVKEVVEYCVRNDLYVLLNIHWDGGWLENNCTKVKQDSVNAKQKAIWEQIATTMRDFDEHLIFASANEPNTKNAEEMSVLLTYHQTFIHAVRSTGGRNTYRNLVIQGSSELINLNNFPKDPTPNRLMYEDHNYTPSQFTFLSEDVSWGKMVYYWGKGNHSTIEPDRNPTYGEEDDHIKYFQKIKQQFVDKGIPVLMGEYGAYRRNNNRYVPLDLELHNKSVDYWLTFVTRQALAHGIKPFYWDTGGALDRRTNTVKDQRTINALIAGAGK